MSSRKSRSRELEVPDEIAGRFLIGDEIGRGSFATVYRGCHSSNRSQSVAIKAVVRGKLTSKLLQNLQDEINILKRIRHGNVVGLVDCISTEHYIYLVMQYCALGDLSMYIKHRRPVPPGEQGKNPEAMSFPPSKGKAPEDRWPHPPDGGLNEWVARSFLGQLADALRFLRQHDIIHRDIKPQNLLLHPSPPSRPPSPSSSSPRAPLMDEDSVDGPFGTTPPPGVTYLAGSGSQNPEAKRYVPEGIPILRVADFGFARVLDPAAGLAETLCGSPLYMAPEILRYEKYDAKADLWSVGAVLYEACVGKPPFRAQNHVELLRRIEKGEDRIVFPDEKPWPPPPNPKKDPSKDDQPPPPKPHTVPDDVKALIRGLLKRNPSERMSFETFFERAAVVSNVGPLKRATPPGVIPSGAKRSASYGTGSGIEGIRPPSTASLPTPSNTSSPTHRLHSLMQKNMRPAPPVPAIPIPATAAKPAPDEAEKEAVGAFVVGPQRPMGPSLTRQGSKDPPPAPRAGPSAPTMNRDPSSGAGRPVHPGHGAPSPSALPSPIPLHRQPSFPAKYVVGGFSNNATSQPIPIEGVKTRDYAVLRPAPGARNGSGEAVVVNARPEGGTGKEGRAVEMTREPSDDDSVVGREYVVVEKRAVEINALVDDIATSPRKPMSLTRRVSRGLMQRPSIPGLGTSSAHSPPPPTPSSAGATGFPSVSFPPRPAGAPSPPSYFGGIGAPDAGMRDRPSPPAIPSNALQPHGQSSPRSYDGVRYLGSPRTGTSGFPASAFARAISLASAKAFGPTSNEVARRGAPVRIPSSPGKGAHTGVGPDSVELRLVAELEDYAQKVLVIVQFADEKLARLLPPTPNNLASPQPTLASPPPQAPPSPAGLGAFAPPPQAAAGMRRTPSSSQEGATMGLSASRTEALAAEATALYFKALAFLDKAIRHAAEVSAQRREQMPSFSPGPEVALAMEWLRSKFNEAFAKADFVKSKAEYFADSTAVATKLIFERALEKSRSAAVVELMGENVGNCELEYETALWMLSALRDPTIRDGDEPPDEDIETFDRFITSIRARLAALRRKMVQGSEARQAPVAASG